MNLLSIGMLVLGILLIVFGVVLILGDVEAPQDKPPVYRAEAALLVVAGTALALMPLLFAAGIE